MSRIKIFLLCLALLGLAGMLHHQWQIAIPANAATLSNGSGQSCAGTGLFHFVNNQTQGQCGQLSATFNCTGLGDVTISGVNATACHNSTDQYYVSTPAGCTLVTATTGDQPGRLVLSDFACAVPTPTPSPTPSPSPAPSPGP
jgi:hypothetical protein